MQGSQHFPAWSQKPIKAVAYPTHRAESGGACSAYQQERQGRAQRLQGKTPRPKDREVRQPMQPAQRAKDAGQRPVHPRRQSKLGVVLILYLKNRHQSAAGESKRPWPWRKDERADWFRERASD